MIYENSKKNDENTPENRLFPSEVGWQTFLMAVHEEGPKVHSTNIRVILNYFIVNDEASQVLYWANRASAAACDGEDGHREYCEDDDGFYAILCCALGACNMRMLIDHKSRTGWRIVDRVIVLKDKLGTRYQRRRSFMIVLSKRRERPSRMASNQVDMKRYLSHQVREAWVPRPERRRTTKIGIPIYQSGRPRHYRSE